MKMTSSIFKLGISAALLSACVSVACANTWTGAVNTSWNNNGNWSESPFPNAAGAVAEIGQGTVIVTSGPTVGTLILGNATTTGGVQVRGWLTGDPAGKIIFDNNGSAALLSAYNNNQSVIIGAGSHVSPPEDRSPVLVELRDDLNIERKGTGTSDLSRNLSMHVNLSITDGKAHTVRILDSSDAGGAVNFMNYSAISDGNGILSIEQNSSKTELWLYGVNSYTGGTTINNGGIVRIKTDEGLGDASGDLRFGVGGGTLYIEDTANSSGAGIRLTRNIIMDGDATLDFSNGSGKRTLDSAISGNGTLTYRANASWNNNTINVWGEKTYTGTTVLDKARVAITRDSSLGDSSNDVQIINGGSLVLNVSASSNRTVRLSNGDGQMGVGMNQKFSWNGNITGSGRLVKNFGGTLVLYSGDNDYTGGTDVAEGMLIFNNDYGSGAGMGDITVKTHVNRAGIGGYGSVAGSVSMADSTTLQVGYENFAGFTIGGDLTLTGNIDLTYGNMLGRLMIGGDFDLGGNTVTINLGDYNSVGMVLATYGDLLNGDLANFVLAGTYANAYSLALDAVNNQLVLNYIPEPAMAGLLMAAGALALAVRKRRQQR